LAAIFDFSSENDRRGAEDRSKNRNKSPFRRNFLHLEDPLRRGRRIPAADLGALPTAANYFEIAVIGRRVDHPNLWLLVLFSRAMTGMEVTVARPVEKLAGLRSLDHAHGLLAAVLLEKGIHSGRGMC
jgi:hypothetical protein